jgi:hypothetical protein
MTVTTFCDNYQQQSYILRIVIEFEIFLQVQLIDLKIKIRKWVSVTAVIDIFAETAAPSQGWYIHLAPSVL